jgi:NAD(P)-dependent dehydrogenase (short-subunit alcohol dehydrogenase family)
MQQELAPFGIKVQTINPGAYFTGYNETMADTAFRWLDDSKNFTKRAALHAALYGLLATPEGHLDPEEMVARMIEVVPSDTGKFRNVCPQFVENMLRKAQVEAWDKTI